MTPTVERLDLYISVDTAARTLRNLADDIVGRMTNLVALSVQNDWRRVNAKQLSLSIIPVVAILISFI
jgi:hypothetical protein